MIIRQRTPLKTLRHVQRELARLYPAMKEGRLAPEDGTKRAFVLTALANLIESRH